MNYFGITVKQARLEGRVQFGGNSFDIRDKIISKYTAWMGFSLFALGSIFNITFIFLQKYTTYKDMGGRSLLFGSILNTLATVAVLVIIFRGAIFTAKFLPRREYFPVLKRIELNNFNNAVRDLTEKKDDPDRVAVGQKMIDQLLYMFDIKVPMNYAYEMKIQELREKVFK